MSSAPANRPPNRLARETSPYLHQHAYNPVDWYPWGNEAFAAARRLDRPIFLSVGYSACHWCHVMEHESFEDEAIAAILNEHYISIKVDREERPDVDQIYMTAVQLMTQRGGWPMSVFMTPDGRPFFGGTYFPPTSRMGMPGFRDILLRLAQVWREQRAEALAAGERLTDAISRVSAQDHGEAELDENLLHHAMRTLIATADRVHGGFGGAPKFPHPMDLRLLLRCARRFDSREALDVARLTLDKMAGGGMYDHLGSGFHRYSTDGRWLVPHFEKMLYDNALLVLAYLEAWQIARESPETTRANGLDAAGYEAVVRETLDYVLREMTQPEGGFYSTQDADSEGEEGKFFVWTEREILDALGPEHGRWFCAAYDVTPHGNWEGHTILNRPRSEQQVAEQLGIDFGRLRESLAQSRHTLFDLRKQRVAPGRDDKVLVSWNGLMISAMAFAGRVLNEARYTNAAIEAARFVRSRMRTDAGRLLHSYKDGRAQFSAYLDDYACLIEGLVELYAATFDATWLEVGTEWADQVVAHFADESGGFFYTAADHEQLITRTKDLQDNATPSGNSMAATALLKLGRLTGRVDLEEAGYRTLAAMSGLLAEHPRAAAQALLALDFHLGPTHELVIVDGSTRMAGDELLAALASRFKPRLMTVRSPVNGQEMAPTLQTHFEGRPRSESTQFYVCQRGACLTPVTTAAEALQQLQLAGERDGR
jgi:uncharacterized protein YyaL (SSP411 family)